MRDTLKEAENRKPTPSLITFSSIHFFSIFSNSQDDAKRGFGGGVNYGARQKGGVWKIIRDQRIKPRIYNYTIGDVKLQIKLLENETMPSR